MLKEGFLLGDAFRGHKHHYICAILISSSYQSPTMPNFPIWLRSAVYTGLIILVQSAFMGRIHFRRFALPRLEPAFSHGAGSNSLENLPITDGRSTFCFNLNCCVLGMGKQIECCPWSIPAADSRSRPAPGVTSHARSLRYSSSLAFYRTIYFGTLVHSG
jgi:hypothetical protein